MNETSLETKQIMYWYCSLGFHCPTQANVHELECQTTFNSLLLQRCPPSNKRPTLNKYPPPLAKMSTRHPSQINNPSSLPFLNSKDTKKTCFSCHFMYNFLHFYYRKISIGDKFLLHSSSFYLLVLGEFFYVHHLFFSSFL